MRFLPSAHFHSPARSRHRADIRRAHGVGWARLALAAVLLAVLGLAACAVHPGGDEIAYLRDGKLWIVNPDGSGAMPIAAGNVVGFAWSPDHHQLVFRYGADAPLAQDEASAPDAASQLGVVGVDGGAVLTITQQLAGLARSDAWWDTSGNRLLYRQGFLLTPGQEPPAVSYILAQADQPAGIAQRQVPDAATIPALAPDGSQVASVDSTGNVRLGAPGASGRILATGALLRLPGGDRPARLLWQPGHQALLYATPGAGGGGAVTLMLTDFAGHARPVGTAPLLDYAFAPGGSLLLVQTPTVLALWRVGGQAEPAVVFSWAEDDPAALAWWSPDGRYVLVRDRTGLRLADVRTQRTQQVLVSAEELVGTAHPMSWRPLAGSPWSVDGRQIVFADPGTGTWQGRALPAPRSGSGGLYVADIAGIGASGAAPRLIASGPASWPGWSYLDPSASFLVAS
jgi:hypothetical protein